MIDVDALVLRAQDLYSQWKIITLSGKIKPMKNDVIKLNFPASWLSDFVIKTYLNCINQHKCLRQAEIDCLLKLHRKGRIHLLYDQQKQEVQL